MEKSYFRFIFFEDLNLGWVLSHSQYRQLKPIAEELGLAHIESFKVDRTSGDRSPV